jgi:hypothetical protein
LIEFRQHRTSQMDLFEDTFNKSIYLTSLIDFKNFKI